MLAALHRVEWPPAGDRLCLRSHPAGAGQHSDAEELFGDRRELAGALRAGAAHRMHQPYQKES